MRLILPLLSAVTLTLLSSCVAPTTPLPSGTKVSFINCVPATLTVQTIGSTVFGNKTDEQSLPGASAMMRRVVMEEARRAGVQCDYSERTLPPATLKDHFAPGGNAAALLKSTAATSSAPIVILASPTASFNPNVPAHLGVQGFGIMQHKAPFFGVTLVQIGAAVQMLRLEKAAPKGEPVIGGNSLLAVFRGFQEKKDWATCLPASRAHANEVFEDAFRAAVINIFGNPPPPEAPATSGDKL
jgi:hypothetical protein